MNFGDILNKWENQKPGLTESGGNSADTDSEKKPNPMDSWIREKGIYDKDAEEEKPISAQEKRRRLKNKKPDAEIDIHGQTRDEAWQALETFFNESKANGYEKVLIIHGKGNHSTGESVLKRMVLEFIEHCPIAGESGRGKSSAGGEGATWVLLKEMKNEE
jgi:DNA-nicking Smr family endonuclease